MYRSNDGVDYEEIATVDKAERVYFDEVEAGTYYYKVTAYRSYCESTPAWTNEGQDYILVEVTSVGECTDEVFRVFPSPANAQLCVEAEGLSQVVVYNVMGQVVYAQNCNEDGLVINTANFAEGVYTISIKSMTGRVTKRFAVVH